MARRVVFVKLGGSLVTDKRREGIVRRSVLARLAGELASAAAAGRGRIVLGHGSGSFGHAAAAAAGLTRGADVRRRPDGISRTQGRAAELHRIVVRSLEAAGARPYSLAPSSFLVTRRGRIVDVFAAPLFRALEAGLTPVIYGDVVLDTALGAAIVSTEEVFLALAREVRKRGHVVARAVWLGETEGVYGNDGATIPRLAPSEAVRAARGIRGASGVDVTGGMALRLTAAARLARAGVASVLADGRRPGALRAALAGRRQRGTLVTAGRGA